MLNKKSVQEAKDVAALIEALKARPAEQVRARELKVLTAGKARPHGVPKSIVRKRLDDAPNVNISKDSKGYLFSWTKASAKR